MIRYPFSKCDTRYVLFTSFDGDPVGFDVGDEDGTLVGEVVGLDVGFESVVIVKRRRCISDEMK